MTFPSPTLITRKRTLQLTIMLISLLAQAMAFAAKPVYSGGRERAAIRGYDPVAYFIENKPVKGSEEFVYQYKGAKWLFSSAGNMTLFKANPEKYSPQFGGYCAYAVAKNTTASIKPEYFSIVKGKLYLNYSKSVYKKWTRDKEDLIEDAESNWPQLVDE